MLWLCKGKDFIHKVVSYYNISFLCQTQIPQIIVVLSGFTFFVAQLFSTFLLHAQLFQANIPLNISKQFEDLIEKTCEEIKKNISTLKETDSQVKTFILIFRINFMTF